MAHSQRPPPLPPLRKASLAVVTNSSLPDLRIVDIHAYIHYYDVSPIIPASSLPPHSVSLTGITSLVPSAPSANGLTRIEMDQFWTPNPHAIYVNDGVLAEASLLPQPLPIDLPDSGQLPQHGSASLHSSTHLIRTNYGNRIIYFSLIPILPPPPRALPEPAGQSIPSPRNNFNPEVDVIFLRDPPDAIIFPSSFEVLLRWLPPPVTANLAKLAVELSVWRRDFARGVLSPALKAFTGLSIIIVVATGAEIGNRGPGFWNAANTEVMNTLASLKTVGAWTRRPFLVFVADRGMLITELHKFGK